MRDIIKILTANLGITTLESSKEVSTSDINSVDSWKWRYGPKTGNTYIAEIITDSVDILTINVSGLATMARP